MKKLFLWALMGCAYAIEPAALPPGGLLPAQVPQFIVLGSDDNGSEVDWLVQELSKRKHADGSALHMSFYSNRHADASWTSAHQLAAAQGHELALHTLNHTDLSTIKLDSVVAEFSLNRADLAANVGIPSSQLVGFRAPFLALSDSVFSAEEKLSALYDCSLEEGWQSDKNASNMNWPYSLGQSSQNSAWAAMRSLGLTAKNEALSNHPGLWEVPVYAWEIPAGAAAQALGLPSAFCDTLSQRAQDLNFAYADPRPRGCKVTGFDYNQWFQYGMSGVEYTALLRYNLNRRLQGNRAPLTIGMHANYYGADTEHGNALLQFVDSALTNPAVRFVSARELVEWMQNPRVPVMLRQPQSWTGPSYRANGQISGPALEWHFSAQNSSLSLP